MSLLSLIDDRLTDKNTIHSYLELYHSLLECKKETAKNILEVGIDRGGSIKLWSEFFINATVYGLDIMSYEHLLSTESPVWEGVYTHSKGDLSDSRIQLFTQIDAYQEEFFREQFLKKSIQMDMVLDDGPHTLDSMIKFIQLYSQILTEDGILIIEDVPNPSWLDILTSVTPEPLKKFIKVYDLRSNKGRFDDIVFTIQKNL